MGEAIAVDSVVYNMAGDVANRPNYLKSLVLENVISGGKESMADLIKSGFRQGPSVKMNSFYIWASDPTNYGKIGLPTGKLEYMGSVPPGKVEPEITAPTGYTVEVKSAKVSYADPKFWAERYMLQNHANLYDTNWKWDYKKTTNQVVITFAGGGTESFTASGFDYDKRYLYAYYSLTRNSDDAEGTNKVLIYKIGSGNADLDAIAQDKASYGEFFPFIPVRLDNEFLSTTYLPGVFAQTSAAYRKAVDNNLDDLITSLEDNESLGDIDHVYITFGVSLNTKDNSARKYIYNFFTAMQLAQTGGADAYDDYQAKIQQYERKSKAYVHWLENNQVGPRPKQIPQPELPENLIRIKGTGSVSAEGDIYGYYDVRINWNYIRDFTRNGKGKSGAKPGDVWMSAKTKKIGEKTTRIPTGSGTFSTSVEPIYAQVLTIYWQKSSSQYTYLEITGLSYTNMIYKGHGVWYYPVEVLADPEESGFIVPLHYEIWKSTPIIDRTQMATSCCYAVMNCYQAKKLKWYESGIFQIFISVVIAIVAALFTGGAGFGLLGANLAVGAAVGLTGISAAIAGAAINALAAVVLTTVISKVAEGFGAFGAILSTLLGMVIGGITSASATGTAFNWSSLIRVDNIMKLMNSVGDAMVSFVNESTAGIAEQWNDFKENADKKSLEIQQQYFDEFGYGALPIDPMMFVRQSEIKFESSSTFLTRTMMTGSDVVEMSQELLYNFPKYTLDLPDAFA